MKSFSKMIQKQNAFHQRMGEYGFSFIELMVVIAIGSMLAALAIPSYISKMPHRRLQEASRGLYGAMQQTRLLAVKENRSRSLGFANDGTDFFYFDEDGDDTYDVGEKRVDLSDQYTDVRFGKGTAPNPPARLSVTNNNPATLPFVITFTPTGAASSAMVNNTIYLENITSQSESFAVIVQGSGAVKIAWFDKTTWK
jgi:type IV fimbrial biogenesis protein FimT